MLQAGKNITQVNDPMQKLQVDQLYKALCKPRPNIQDAIVQLRNVLTIDAKKYSLLKRKLPYVTCGIFNPPFRRTEHFASIEVFILDIDHISEKGLTCDQLKEKLKADRRIELMFESPGGDGLKILFRLSEKCFDHAKYSMFYKVFAQAFSEQYGLNQVIDTRTSDVARACFISVDRKAFYNQEAEKIKMITYIDFNDPFQVMEIKAAENKETKSESPEPKEKELTDDILQNIKQKLNPNIRTSKPKNITIPTELDEILPNVTEHTKKYEIVIAEVKNIHYGKQIKFAAGHHFAVINLFYGKNGYKVVVTNKSGSSEQLAEIAKKVLCELLYD
jgi:hypothetical protein